MVCIVYIYYSPEIDQFFSHYNLPQSGFIMIEFREQDLRYFTCVQSFRTTMCPRSSDPFYIVFLLYKRVTTSWTYSIKIFTVLSRYTW